MNQAIDDNGLMTVLMERYQKQRLPHIQALQAKVERGEPLISFDIMFLKEVASSVNELKPFLDRHPDCNRLATHMVNICAEVAEKGLANEPRQ